MNAFLTIFAYFLKITPAVVVGIQTIHGDQASGADKKKMAQDVLALATATALSTLTGNNAQLAAAASVLAGGLIDAAVVQTKADGTYAAATTASQGPATAA